MQQRHNKGLSMAGEKAQKGASDNNLEKQKQMGHLP